MKNLKMFAIAVMAFAVMAMGVHAEKTVNGLTCTEDSISATNAVCTLKSAGTLSGDVDGNLTIKAAKDKTVTISSSVTIKAGTNLTIEGGRLILKANVIIEDGATLKVTKVPVDDVAANDHGAIDVQANSTITVTGGTLEVSDNLGKGFYVGGVDLTIDLSDEAHFALNNNKLNAMNGVGTGGEIKADHSTIEVKDNGLGGLNGKVTLVSSTITATGNGYQGVTFAGSPVGSSIDKNSKVIANNNLKGYEGDDIDKRSDKADVLINGTLTVKGELTADSMAPLKKDNGNLVNTYQVKLEDNGIVRVNESKALCNGNFGGTCAKGDQKSITATGDSQGLLVVNGTATVKGTGSVKVPSDIKKVVIEGSNGNVIVAPGTEVENNSGSKLIVHTTDGSVYEVAAGRSAVLGTAAPSQEEQNPEGQPGTTEPGTTGDGNQGTTDNVKNPETNDNILVYAGLGLVSLASVAFTAKKRED